MDYVRNHWRGDHSLLWSFWVNLVALRLVILFFERFTHPPFTEQSTAAIAFTVLYFVVFQLIVCVWQIRGVVKTCDRFMAESGSYSTVLLAQFGIVVGLCLTLYFVLAAFLSLLEDPEAKYEKMFRPQPSLLGEYSLTLSEGGTRLLLKGDFRIGITKELSTFLERNPNLEGIVLSSNGGRVTEGRGVARLIKKNGLDTYVFDACKSACMTAFIGGATRNLGAQGKLGFHQFLLKNKMNIPYLDVEKEQKIDLAFYTEQKIEDSFLKKVFQASHTDIWFPSHDELLAAGVVHKILTEQ